MNMDQNLEDIDPDARKKYDRDMKQQAKEALRRDALHLSDDDFGSKHGRDRTAKETAARNANETAGYKAAEADAKKEAKQGSLFGDDMQNNPNKAEMDRRAAKDKEDKAAAREAKKAEKDIKGDAPKQASMISPKGNTTAAGRGSTGGGGGGGMGNTKLSNRDLTKAYKKGGKVSSASKRADGCAIKGKTRGRMV
jgi:hypothetical protein